MIQEITLFGRAGENIEYYATVAGRGMVHGYFYESPDGAADRFFFAGKEFVIEKGGIRHKGNGGSFCEYMFGVEQPLKDMVKKDVLNRLAMYGAVFDEAGRLTFTGKTDGYSGYEEIFMEGNAVGNYFFFLDIKLSDSSSSQQEQILRLIGKTLKYSPSVGRGDDRSLMAELAADLDGYDPAIFLFRLVNRYHKRYYDLFREFYSENKEISEEGERLLSSLATEFNIGQYQQERIKTDVIYNHPENKRILDEYKDILISFEKMEEIGHSDVTGLNRLRALAIKKNIPLSILDLLDELLLKDKKFAHGGQEPDYIKDSRILLDGLFAMEGSVTGKNDLIKLLFDKKRSLENRDLAFDSLLLDTGKTCDEKYQKGEPGAIERFSELITYFDRFDTTSQMISRMAFMEEDVPVEKLRSILGNMRVFEEIQTGLFDTLFIRDLLGNRYLTSSGRRKVTALSRGLEEVEKGYRSLSDVAKKISSVNEEERMYQNLYAAAKERWKKFPRHLDRKSDQDAFLKEVLKGLLHEGPVKKITKEVMKMVFISLKMEIFYVNEVLPGIIETGNMKAREDFLHNSGFDRFYVEEVEREFMEKSALPPDAVKRFREMVEVG